MMPISVKDIAWIAGILEGEAYFGLTNKNTSPQIAIGMTDLDTVERLRNIIDKSKSIGITVDKRKEEYKNMYRFTVNGSKAVEWMLTIYSLMSVRRKARFRECLDAWKQHEFDSKFINSPEAKARAGLTRKLRNLGFSDIEVSLASGMKKMGLSEQSIRLELDKLRIKEIIQ